MRTNNRQQNCWADGIGLCLCSTAHPAPWLRCQNVHVAQAASTMILVKSFRVAKHIVLVSSHMSML